MLIGSTWFSPYEVDTKNELFHDLIDFIMAGGYYTVKGEDGKWHQAEVCGLCKHWLRNHRGKKIVDCPYYVRYDHLKSSALKGPKDPLKRQMALANGLCIDPSKRVPLYEQTEQDRRKEKERNIFVILMYLAVFSYIALIILSSYYP